MNKLMTFILLSFFVCSLIMSSVALVSASPAAPNKPTNLLPSARQITTTVKISCVVSDNDSDPINVFFYDDADQLIDNIWIESGEKAEVNWTSLERGVCYTFYANGVDINTNEGEDSDFQAFVVNSLPTEPTAISLNVVTAGEVLTASASGSTDVEEDPITYYYKFYNQTDDKVLRDYSTTSAYKTTASDALDKIVVYVKAYDGYEYSSVESNSVVVSSAWDAGTPPPYVPPAEVVSPAQDSRILVGAVVVAVVVVVVLVMVGGKRWW